MRTAPPLPPISNLQSPISNLQSPVSGLQAPLSPLTSNHKSAALHVGLQSPISGLQSSPSATNCFRVNSCNSWQKAAGFSCHEFHEFSRIVFVSFVAFVAKGWLCSLLRIILVSQINLMLTIVNNSIFTKNCQELIYQKPQLTTNVLYFVYSCQHYLLIGCIKN